MSRFHDVSGKCRYILETIDQDFELVEELLSAQNRACLGTFCPPDNRHPTTTEKWS